MEEKVLVMVFKTGAGKSFRITLDNPKEGITPEEVTAAMNLIISKDLFDVDGGVTEASEANIITTNKEVLSIA